MKPWVNRLLDAILELDYKIVGCSTLFQQTAASVAILRGLKALRPEIVTIIGGANCEGEMAEGLLSISADIDFVFSGESEESFPKFLEDVRSGNLPARQIVEGEPCRDLDQLPTPDYADYYRQYAAFLPDSGRAGDSKMWLSYETSRGCWWGQKHHCTFCGLNGKGMAFRAKSPDRVMAELKDLLQKHPSRQVLMTDNIMPHHYFRDVIPRIETELPGLEIFYEQKANLSLAKVMGLKKAGVTMIQPGIESLSSPILKLMDKGVSAKQNIALLRYAASAGLSLSWNLIYGFPGDRIADYEQMLRLLPLLVHLQPPSGLWPLSVDRFSPYYDQPEKYGLENVRPWKVYDSILPPGSDISKVAYHFTAAYRSESMENLDVMSELSDEVQEWQRTWEDKDAFPVLAVTSLTNRQFLLLDTRGLPGTQTISFITAEQARVVLTESRTKDTGETQWAVQSKFAIELDSVIVPLATAEPPLIEKFERQENTIRRRPLPLLELSETAISRLVESLRSTA
jgi:ribosomal peptide maturation radical SAM protein 1